MKEKLKEMYDYLMKNAEALEVDPDLTFEQFVVDSIEAYEIEKDSFESFDEFVKYENSQMYNW